jgi:hypothetical protein
VPLDIFVDLYLEPYEISYRRIVSIVRGGTVNQGVYRAGGGAPADRERLG